MPQQRNYDGKCHVLHVRDMALHREFKRLCRREGRFVYIETTKILRAWVAEHQQLEQEELRAKRLREQREEELSGFEARKAAVDTPDAGASTLLTRPPFWARPGAVKKSRTLQ